MCAVNESAVRALTPRTRSTTAPDQSRFVMAVDDRTPSRSTGNLGRVVAIALMAIMAVLLIFALFWNPMSVK